MESPPKQWERIAGNRADIYGCVEAHMRLIKAYEGL